MRILFLSAEVKPFTKVGGLGDVAGSLPAALRTLGHDVRVFTPAHRATEERIRRGHLLRAYAPIRVRLGEREMEAGVLSDVLPGTDVPVFFLAQREHFDRERVYGYDDDPWRFTLFCRGVFTALPQLEWMPEVVSAHDWHTAPAVSWVARSGDPVYGGIPTVFTIHNLAHQGHADRKLLEEMGVPAPRLGVEEPGRVNLMAQAIHDATAVSTVSPTYAAEILTPLGGAGLDGLLSGRREKPVGIVNGLDYDEWDPARDPFLPERYDERALDRRRVNRAALERELGWVSGGPVIVMVSRLDRQKGVELLPEVFHRIAHHPSGARVAVLGSGEPEQVRPFRGLERRHPGRVRLVDRFDNDLAHRMYGAGDMVLMPSLFEPCGLTQLIGMRYGCPPVVRATGGLADTVDDGVSGFRFDAFEAGSCWAAVERALDCMHGRPERWVGIQRAGMERDSSWTRSARTYAELYRGILRTGETLSRSGP